MIRVPRYPGYFDHEIALGDVWWITPHWGSQSNQSIAAGGAVSTAIFIPHRVLLLAMTFEQRSGSSATARQVLCANRSDVPGWGGLYPGEAMFDPQEFNAASGGMKTVVLDPPVELERGWCHHVILADVAITYSRINGQSPSGGPTLSIIDGPGGVSAANVATSIQEAGDSLPAGLGMNRTHIFALQLENVEPAIEPD